MATRRATNANASIANVLGELGNLAAQPTVKAAGKPTKWILPLTDDAKAEATRWAKARAILEPIEKRVEAAKAEVNEYALGVMAEKIFEAGYKPSNPSIVLTREDGDVDHEFSWLMTDKFKLRFPDVPEGASNRDHLVGVVGDCGLHPTDAEALVDNELDFAPVIGFRSLTELLEGRYGEGREFFESSDAEKRAGSKLAALIRWTGEGVPEALTLEEKALVLERSPNVTVKAGFYGRVKTYCRSADQVKALFRVIQPIVYPSHLKFAKSDSVQDQARRKISAAAEILGV